MAAPQQQNESDFQSYEVRSKKLTFTMFLTTTVCFALFFFIIVRAYVGGRTWVHLLPAIGVVAIPLILHPISSQWVYKPWQARRRKNERTYLD